MLTIEYCKEGEACNDFELDEKAEWLRREYLKGRLNFYKTSSELFVTRLRVMICQKQLPHAEVAFHFEHHEIFMDKDGRTSNWPQGFCDNVDKLLTILVKWD